MREQKLLEEKLEKQREKEQKEQQRKVEREEKGKCLITFLLQLQSRVLINYDELFSFIRIFRGTTQT